MRSRDFHSGYKGQPGDPAPLHGGWEARAFSERCNTIVKEVMNFGIPTVVSRCGQRRFLQPGGVYACPVCDATALWP